MDMTTTNNMSQTALIVLSHLSHALESEGSPRATFETSAIRKGARAANETAARGAEVERQFIERARELLADGEGQDRVTVTLVLQDGTRRVLLDLQAHGKRGERSYAATLQDTIPEVRLGHPFELRERGARMFGVQEGDF